jgi:hypothetical protein
MLSLTNPRLEVETVGLMDLAVETAGLDEADLQPVSGLAESGEHGVVALCERNVTFASFLVPLSPRHPQTAVGGDEG